MRKPPFKPRSIRRSQLKASLHLKSRFLSAHLSEELRRKYGRRSIRVRKGDTVKVMRGDYKGVQGKILRVFVKEGFVTIEGLTREKVRGENVPVKIRPSNLLVVALNLDDKARKQALERGE
jgi:large subunit ribosomal protein L24